MSAVFDYIVVGAGSAGCVLANRLSADPATSVLLIEAGREPDWMLSVPGLTIRNSTTPKFNWSYATEPEPALGDRSLFWAQGKTLGGSSSINGMIYARGNAREYDAWRDAGCTGWGFDDLLPYFRRSEGSDRGDSQWHGALGPLKVSRGRPVCEIAERVLEAAAQDGFTIRGDFNEAEQEGFGHYDVSIGAGRRSSTASAFLTPVAGRPNLTVMTRTLALRIRFRGARAVGLDLETQGRAHAVEAAREIVLSGGVVNSPQLLMLSGIGPADHLRAHGLTVVADSPDVGGNLQNHVSLRLQYAVSEPITAFRYCNVAGAAKAGAEYVFRRSGVLADSVVPTGGFFRTDPSLAVTDMQVQVGVGLMGRPGKSVLERLPKEHGFSLGVNQGRPWSRGEVRLKSADPRVAPAISPRYFSDPRDLAALIAGVRRMRGLAARPALATIVTREVDNPADDSDAAIAATIRARAGTAFHGVGTCRMGGDAGSVVDPALRVRGVTGLRVADAAAIPLLMNANTNAAAIMMGERAAALILEE